MIYEQVSALENYALTRLIYEALVREGNAAAQDVAALEPNTPAWAEASDYYHKMLQAVESAQAAIDRYEVPMLRQLEYYVEADGTTMMSTLLDALRIAGGRDVARAMQVQIYNRRMELATVKGGGQ